MPKELPLAQLVDPAALTAALADGLVLARRHPTLPLTVYNYTPKAAFQHVWTPVTLTCRGLIVADDGQVVARPLAKFFNLDEHRAELGEPPAGPFTVWDKLDGSLLIVTRYAEQLVAATRGSFTSEQAAAGRRLLAGYDTTAITEGTTWLFEVIDASSQVVLTYDFADVVLLTVRDTATGAETLPDDPALAAVGFRRAARIHADSLDALAADAAHSPRTDVEGFVVRFADGTRVKVKYAEYVRLHKLLAGLTPKTVWQWLRDGEDLTARAAEVPDEWFPWLQTTVATLREQMAAIDAAADAAFTQVAATAGTADRKAFAQAVLADHRALAALLFAKLDGRDVTAELLKRVRPDGTDPSWTTPAAARAAARPATPRDHAA